MWGFLLLVKWRTPKINYHLYAAYLIFMVTLNYEHYLCYFIFFFVVVYVQVNNETVGFH